MVIGCLVIGRSLFEGLRAGSVAGFPGTKVEVEDSKRGFCQFIMEPIINLHKKILAGDAAWETMAEKLGVKLSAEDKKLTGKALLKKVMSTW